jgi:hypothetical protein
VVVPGWVDDWERRFETLPLPKGPWTIQLRASNKVVTVETVAGATLSLLPK